MKSIEEKLKKNQSFMKIIDNVKYYIFKYLFTDETLIKYKFKKRLGRKVDLKNPVKFNDKLQWLKLNWHDPIATQAADKYRVRELVKERIGKKYLNELYAVYESVDEIDLEKLPNSFVLKGTHGSGYNIICKDKSKMDWKKEFKKMKRWLNTNYFWQNREWVYKDIKPRIIAEKYMEDPNTRDLKDYKFFCFNGEPKFIQVDIGRFEKHRKNLYDLDWNLIPVKNGAPSEKIMKIQKPSKLREMIELSKKLSNSFPHARVDFYYVNEKIIFGEITFFHMSGMSKYEPDKFEIVMGHWLELPEK